jgi:hypothetical protein
MISITWSSRSVSSVRGMSMTSATTLHAHLDTGRSPIDNWHCPLGFNRRQAALASFRVMFSRDSSVHPTDARAAAGIFHHAGLLEEALTNFRS